jgi:hypothetical protein
MIQIKELTGRLCKQASPEAAHRPQERDTWIVTVTTSTAY